VNGTLPILDRPWRRAGVLPYHLIKRVRGGGFSDPYRDFAMPGGIREKGFGYGRDRVVTGRQRAALRRIDPTESQPWEPIPTCTDPQPLHPGETVAVDVALGPSATLFRAGEQLRLLVAARWLAPVNPLFGAFPSRYARSRRGTVSLHWGQDRPARLLIPEIPALSVKSLRLGE
jgi:hypothetical protein